MNKQVKSFYDIANDYHIAAVTLWEFIFDMPYLYSPISFLLRHTIELQLKGLIVLERWRDDSTIKISDIKILIGSKEKKMNEIHSVKILWEYYKQLFYSHSLPIYEAEFKTCDRLLSILDKKDYTSTRYRYPYTKDDASVNFEPINICYTDIAPDISTRIPTIVANGTTAGIIDKGQRLLRDTRDTFDSVEFLFGLFDH